MNDINAKQYVEAGKHLPDFLKDFHDQKDFFKAMYEQWGGRKNPSKNQLARCPCLYY